MGVGYCRTRNHQSVKVPVGEGARTQSWLTWQAHGNDCVIYLTPLEPEGCVQGKKARGQQTVTRGHYFSEWLNQDDLHHGDKYACRLITEKNPQFSSTVPLHYQAFHLVSKVLESFKRVLFIDRLRLRVFSRNENNIKQIYF